MCVMCSCAELCVLVYITFFVMCVLCLCAVLMYDYCAHYSCVLCLFSIHVIVLLSVCCVEVSCVVCLCAVCSYAVLCHVLIWSVYVLYE